MGCKDLAFRMFVSSTFSDLIDERNALQECTFPRLRKYCRQRGACYEAVDLQLSLREETLLNPRTEEIVDIQQAIP